MKGSAVSRAPVSGGEVRRNPEEAPPKMINGHVDIHSPYAWALQTQPKTAELSNTLPCPYCASREKVFPHLDDLINHVTLEHASILQNIDRECVRVEALRMKAAADRSSEATAGGSSTLNIRTLSLLDSAKGPMPSPSLARKSPAETEFQAPRGKAQGPTVIYHLNHPNNILSIVPVTGTKNQTFVEPQRFEWSTNLNHRNEGTQLSHPSLCQVHSQHPSSHAASTHSSIGTADSPSPNQDLGLSDVTKHDPRYPDLLLQPDSRPISQEQLAAEVKSIYAGLIMIETKCIHVDRTQATDKDSEIPWQALIALHRTLLHEHHDFFLASQHPSASPALRRLAEKYDMPGRMWRYGIYSFLELLRHRLPESIDYMLAFIYLAYQMTALLYEAVPAFEDTWIECLGDMGRYCMAVEQDARDREIWQGVARSWYNKTVDRIPNVGRLYHHLAILARPVVLTQLYYYARSLTCVQPFGSARDSILKLLDPVLALATSSGRQVLHTDTNFIRAHAILFKKLEHEDFEDVRITFLGQLDSEIGTITTKWKEKGVHIAVSNIAGLFDYGTPGSILRQSFLIHWKVLQSQSQSRPSTPDEESSQGSSEQALMEPSLLESEIASKLDTLSSDSTFSRAYLLLMSTFSTVLRRVDDKNVLPHVHVMLAFLSSIAAIPQVAHLADHAPWAELASFLNTLATSKRAEQFVPEPLFPPLGRDNLPLPDDYWIRGQLWCQWYFPDNWFSRDHDEEDRYLEPPSTVRARAERVLRFGCQIATLDRWISYDLQSHTFTVKTTSLDRVGAVTLLHAPAEDSEG